MLAASAIASIAISAAQIRAFAGIADLSSTTWSAGRAAVGVALFVGAEVGGSALWKYLSMRQSVGAVRLSLATSVVVSEQAGEVDPIRFEDREFYDSLERVREGLGQRPTQLLNGMIDSVIGIGTGVGAFIALFMMSPYVAGVSVFVLLIPLSTIIVASRADHDIFDTTLESARRAGYLTGIATDRHAVPENRVYGFGHRILIEVRQLATAVSNVHARRNRRAVLIETAGLAAMAVVATVVLFYLSRMESFLVLLFAYQRLDMALGLFSQGVGDFAAAAPFLRSASDLTEQNERSEPSSDGRVAVGSQQADVELAAATPRIDVLFADRVGFAYPGTERLALEPISFTLQPGVSVLRGRNGAGKSTLLSCLSGLFPPTYGSISVNGSVTRPEDLLAVVSYQPQRPFQYELSFDTVLEGGEPRVDDAAVWYDFFEINELRDGLPYKGDTLLGKSFEGGTDLSIGEWQRLALARAFARKSALLLLDEPTSFLDAKFAARVAEAISTLDDKVVVVATHDPQLLEIVSDAIEL